jgi:predicted secreted protein
MKTEIQALSTLITALLVFAAVAAASEGTGVVPSIRAITDDDNGATFACRVGQRIIVKIRNPATGGYNVVTPVFAPEILKLLTKKELPPEPAAIPRMGDFGTIVFELEIIGKGETDLTIEIARDWEVKKRPEEFLKVKMVASE